MSTFLRPGAYVSEVLTANNAPGNAPSAQAAAAFVGVCNRGPTTPTLVTSWQQYKTLFGDFSNSAYLAYAVYLFFLGGGHACYVTRVSQSGQVAATRTLNDTAGTPLPTLKLTAYSPGTWGNNISFDITAGHTSGYFNLIVYYGGTSQSNIVEQFLELTMVTTDARYAPSVINSTTSGSQYVVATDMGSTTAFPNNAPSTQTGTALATGADGSAPIASDFNNVINLHGAIDRPLVMNLPGVYDATTVGNAITFAAANNGFVVVDPQQGQTVSAVTTWSGTLTASSYAAAYYPWIKINDPAKFTVGTQATVPPGGAVVAQFIANDAAKGPYKTPAGVTARVPGALDLETTLQPSDYDTLNSATAPVNAIKPVPGYGICIFGGRTLKPGFSDKYVAVRRSLNYLERSLQNLTKFAVFETNDSRLWSSIQGQVSDFLRAYYNAGGLAGNSTSEAYYVVCDSSINTPQSVANGVVNLQVGVALQYPAEFVVITIGQFDGGTTVTNSLAQ